MPDKTHVLVAVAPYYRHITDMLLTGVSRTLDKADVSHEIVEVAGAFELPFAISAAHETGAFDAYITLGCVIRGETSHYDLICNEVARAVQTMATDGGLVIGFGLLTVENEEQALVRANADGKNKGGEAARACLMNLALARRFSQN